MVFGNILIYDLAYNRYKIWRIFNIIFGEKNDIVFDKRLVTICNYYLNKYC